VGVVGLAAEAHERKQHDGHKGLDYRRRKGLQKTLARKRAPAHPKPEYLALPDGVHYVRGPVGAALYDLRDRKVWSVPALFARALERCAQGALLETALAELAGGPPAPDTLAFVRSFARRHPALALVPTVPAKPTPPPVTRTFGLKFLILELTDACNLRCRHCFLPARFGETPGETLPLARWIELLHEAHAIGYRSLLVTGGEPMLLGGLARLLLAAHRAGFARIELLTNATRLTDGLLTALAEARAAVFVSIYSNDPAVHDAVTGAPGSFDRTIAAVRRLLARGIETNVNLVIMDRNAASHGDTIAFLRDLGVAPDRIRSSRASLRGRCAEHLPDARPPRSLRGLDGWATDGARLIKNGCWTGNAAIIANGDVLVCVGERAPVGNVARAPLRSVIESPALRALWNITLDDVPGCAPCEFRFACADCRAEAHTYAGDLLARDPTCPYDPATGQWHCDPIAPDDRPTRREGLHTAELDGHLLVADLEAAQMHVLNPLAAAIWDLCNGRRTPAAIAGLLADHFRIPLEAPLSDTQRALGELRTRALIETNL